MNAVSLVGNLTRDPESRDCGGHQKCSFGIAVPDGKDKKTGEERTMFIDVTAWNKKAALCMQYINKGDKIGVTGKLQLDQWQDRETGARRSKHSITLMDITFLSSKQERQAPPAGPDIGGGQDPSKNYPNDSMGEIQF